VAYFSLIGTILKLSLLYSKVESLEVLFLVKSTLQALSSYSESEESAKALD